MATNRQTEIHTHVRNAVMLVWGSLRLAPIKSHVWIQSQTLQWITVCECVGGGGGGGGRGGWEGLKLKVASYTVLTLWL